MRRNRGFAYKNFYSFKKGFTDSCQIALLTLCVGYCSVIAGETSAFEVLGLIANSFYSLIAVILVLRLLATFVNVVSRSGNIASDIFCTLSYIMGCAVASISFMRYSLRFNVCSVSFLQRCVFSFCVVLFGVSLVEVVGKMLDDRSVMREKGRTRDAKSSDSLERVRLHEAGHAVMTYLLEGVSGDIHVHEDGSGIHTLTIEQLSAEDVKKVVLIKYAGAAAEELVLGNYQAGCGMGSDSDFMRAVDYIKVYLIMTDPSCSKTGLESDINDKIIKISNDLYDEAKALLDEHIDKVRILAGALDETNYLSSERVKEILSASFS